MLNMIRMELYRMFRTKSFYIIGLILTVGVVLTTYLTSFEMKAYMAEEKQEQYEYATGQGEEEQVNLGMTINLLTEPGKDVTVFDVFYANLAGKFIALFIVIFAVLYSSADMTSGFIKNVAGQVRDRGGLVIAKAASLFVYCALMMLFFAAVQTASNGIFFDKLIWGPWKDFLLYGGVQILLHFSYALIAMCITILFRNNVISMIAVVCMCMNILVIFYGFIDKAVGKLGIKDFHVADYTVSGKIMQLPMDATAKEAWISCAVAAVFIVAALVIGGMVFRKRDI